MCYYKAFHGVAPNRWRSFPICKALQSVVRCRFLGLIILRCGVVGAVFCCKGTQKSFGAVGFGKNHTEPHLTVRKKPRHKKPEASHTVVRYLRHVAYRSVYRI